MGTVGDFMTRKVLTTSPERTVLEAAKSMRAGDRGSIVVVENGKPVAIMTERDLLKKLVAEGLSPHETRVKDIMSSPLVAIGPDEPLKNAAKLMKTKGVRRLPVLKGGALVGIITEADLAAVEPHELL